MTLSEEDIKVGNILNLIFMTGIREIVKIIKVEEVTKRGKFISYKVLNSTDKYRIGMLDKDGISDFINSMVEK